MSVSFFLPHPVVVSVFIICSKVRPRIFVCVVMGSVVLFILRSRLLLYSAEFGVNRVASCFVWI